MPGKHVGLWKVWACLLYIIERPVSSGSCQDLNARKIFKRGNVNRKSRGMEEKEGNIFKNNKHAHTFHGPTCFPGNQ